MIYLGLTRFNEEDLMAERDTQMRGKYYDPIEKFPDRIDQLFVALDKVCRPTYSARENHVFF